MIKDLFVKMGFIILLWDIIKFHVLTISDKFWNTLGKILRNYEIDNLIISQFEKFGEILKLLNYFELRNWEMEKRKFGLFLVF